MTIATTRRQLIIGIGSLAAAPMWLCSPALAAGAKTIVGVIEEDPPFLNPAISSTISSYCAGTPVYSALTRMDVKGNVSGDLAESWDISPDGLVYTFHLRKNILWHDGKPFSSADVKFSLEQANSKLHPYRGAMKAIASFEAPEPSIAVLRLSHPQSSLINTLHNYAGCILPKHLWEGTDILNNPYNKKPIGTGAYKFVEFVVGDHITYVKNDKYFLPGVPAFDELTFRIMPDPAARVAAFEKGELDMVYASALPASQVDRLKKLPGVEMKFASIAAGAYLGYINMRNAPYSDVRVRRAIAHAIDRTFIRNTVFPGLSENMVGPLPPSSPLYNKGLKDYEFNPAIANQLLDEAGFKRGADGTRFPFRYLFAVNDLPAAKMGDVIAQNLAAVGIKTVLTPLERATLTQKAYIQSEFDMVVGSFGLGPDPDVGVERFYNSSNIIASTFVNNSAYVNPAVDKLFDEQRVAPDLARRKAVYDKIQEIVWNDIPVFPICAYSLPGALRTSYAVNIFEEEASNRDDFVFAKPAKT